MDPYTQAYIAEVEAQRDHAQKLLADAAGKVAVLNGQLAGLQARVEELQQKPGDKK